VPVTDLDAFSLRVPRHLRRQFIEGAKQMLPLSAGGAVFGLAMGALIAAYDMPNWAGAIGTVMLNAGAAQLALMDLADKGAPWVIIIATVAVVQARFALYSASLAKVYKVFPRRWRIALAFVLTDQAAAFEKHFTPLIPDPVRRRWFFLGGASLFAGMAIGGTLVGILLGPVLPKSWQIGFIVPLMFLAIILRTVSDRPGVMAAVVSAAVAVTAHGMPYGSNVIVATLSGILVTRLVAPASWYRGAPTGEIVEPREGTP
jgi:predicted branched-subunit amino acid permease